MYQGLNTMYQATDTNNVGDCQMYQMPDTKNVAEC